MMRPLGFNSQHISHLLRFIIEGILIRISSEDAIRELAHIAPAIKGLTTGLRAMGINRFAASMYVKFTGKVRSLKKIKSGYQTIYTTFKSIKNGLTSSLGLWSKSKLAKSLTSVSSLKIGSIFSKIAPFFDIGLGIWDILRGQAALKGGLSHEIRASAKTLSYQVDVMVGAYKELMGKDILILYSFIYFNYLIFSRKQRLANHKVNV